MQELLKRWLLYKQQKIAGMLLSKVIGSLNTVSSIENSCRMSQWKSSNIVIQHYPCVHKKIDSGSQHSSSLAQYTQCFLLYEVETGPALLALTVSITTVLLVAQNTAGLNWAPRLCATALKGT